MNNYILFSIPSLIWGSTWLAITFQLGKVDPLVSVVYRFLLASIILLLYCHIAGLNLKYSVKEHLYIALQGLLLFGINYWLVYLAELYLPSGLVAVIFSTIIFMNILNSAIFLKSTIRFPVLAGAVLGTIGIVLVFRQELLSFSLSSDNSFAFFVAILGSFLASLGNITSARNQKHNLPVVQTNAFGMMYGALLMAFLSVIMKKDFSFEVTFSYMSSLLYLSVFGSIVAFSCFLTLLGKIGADKAAYVALVIPIIALILSTIFEGYGWTVYALIGIVFILTGNVMVLIKKD